MAEFAVQPVAVASCAGFNAFVKNEGWTDFNGVKHPNLAGGTQFDIRWKATFITRTKQVDGQVEAYTDQVQPGWYAIKRMGRLEWVPPEPVAVACSDAIRIWGEGVERHELDHGVALDAMFAVARKKPVIARFAAKAATERRATKRLNELISVKLGELAGPLREQAKAEEEKYHETHLVPPLDCDAC